MNIKRDYSAKLPYLWLLHYLWLRISRYVEGERLFWPKALEIQPTALCNYSCKYCSYWRRNKSRLWIPEEVLIPFCAEIGNIDDIPISVYLSGGGEPLLYKGIRKVVETIVDRPGLSLALVTNGSLMFHKNNRVADFADKFGYIHVSLHSGADQARKLRFDPEQRALKIPSELGDRKPAELKLRVIINDHNYKDIFDKLESAWKAGYDYVVYTVERDYEGRGLGLKEENFEMLKKMIYSRWDEADDKFCNLREVAARLNHRDVYIPTPICWAVELRLLAVIDPKGDVYTCIYHIGREEFCLGNIIEKNFSEIWNSPKHLEIINKLHFHEKSGRCRNCRFFKLNSLLQNLYENWKHREKELHEKWTAIDRNKPVFI